MKDILLIGCSNGMDLHKYFRDVFGEENNYINLSAPGLGNTYIKSRLIEYVENNQKPDFVYLQFTGLSRIDLSFDMKVDLGDYEYYVNTKKRKWVASGGRNGSWTSSNLLKKIFAYMYPIKEDIDTELSFQEIFTAVEYCRVKNINLSWTSYYDYINPPCDKARIDGFTDKLPEYIDTNDHLGYFPLNIAYEMSEIPEDDIHYNEKVKTEFFSKCKKQIENKILSNNNTKEADNG